LSPYPHTAEFFNEGVGVRVIRKAESRVLHGFEHALSSIRRLIVQPRVAEFTHFANAIGPGDLDRDLVGKIAINLLLRDLTFASDHRRQKVKSKNSANGPLTVTRSTTQRVPNPRWLSVSVSGMLAAQRGTPQKGLDGGKSLVRAAGDSTKGGNINNFHR
jgi:hypothetical protein